MSETNGKDSAVNMDNAGNRGSTDNMGGAGNAGSMGGATDASGKSGSRTLLMSVIMSAPGPLVVGLGLIIGRSSTQLADFFRRSAELLAIIASFVVYRRTHRDEGMDTERKAQMERRSNYFVGWMMCVSGTFMVMLALFGGNSDKGNVVAGLVIAIMGVIANTIFWIRYRMLSRRDGNVILAVQSRLYRAKSLVDSCVTAVLIVVMVMPGTQVALWLDLAGSLVVALYLVWCGIKTILENRRPTPQE